jgi:hypothetical protein
MGAAGAIGVSDAVVADLAANAGKTNRGRLASNRSLNPSRSLIRKTTNRRGNVRCRRDP